ncbi:hypothetical protein FB451DRAFT_1180626 [Mycena latifolia]|nr:hypothetical protein FB451DRAFT_1180626 [Mycena latifolia]
MDLRGRESAPRRKWFRPLVIDAAAYLFPCASYPVAGTHERKIQDAVLAPDAPTVALWINGLHVHAGVLFTNSAMQTFAGVPISADAVGVQQAGAVQLLGSAGRARVATHPGSLTLFFQLANGTWAQETVAGDPDASNAVFMDPTDPAFGRLKGEDKLLYVVTLGGRLYVLGWNYEL